MKKLKHFLLAIIILTFASSCVNMGLYDSMEFEDKSGNEYVIKHAFGGYYFLEVKNDSGIYVPDNRYERKLKKECKEEKN